jgi:uncharacterized protein YaiE (UPF0345 family)
MKAIIFTSFLILSLVPLLAQNPDPSIRDTALYKQLAEYMPLLLDDNGLGTNSVATFKQIYVGMPGGGASFFVNYNAESEFTGTINVDSIAFNGNPATTRANMGLGWSALTNSNAATRLLGYSTNGGINAVVTPNYLRFTNTVETAGLFIGSYIDWEEGVDGLPASTSRTNLGLGATWLTNNNVTNFRTAIGLGANAIVEFEEVLTPSVSTTDLFISESGSIYLDSPDAAATTLTNLGLGTTNAVTFGTLTAELLQVRVGTNLYVGLADDVSEFWTDVAVNETLSVSGSATFATNVTVNGNLSVGSLTTTTPSTWALDATQTAADTNGILALPSNANVLRITNANTISAVSNGVLGAFYFLINQSGTNVVISNSATITARGATNITLGANESATLISTTATNASAH